MIRLSVVICTYNRAEYLARTLDTLSKQDLEEPFEVVVVDDGSTDETSSVVKQSRSSLMIQYVRQENMGRACARNAGIQKAEGSLILFVDDDVLAPPFFIRGHLKLHQEYPGSVGRGPIVNISETTMPTSFFPTLQDYSRAFFCTCNASARKEDLVRAGLFDESFTEYGFEDNDLGMRLRLQGVRARFSLKAYLFHCKPPVSFGDLPAVREQAREKGRSAVLFLRKHPHWRSRLATGIFLGNFLFRALVSNRCLVPLWERVASEVQGPIPKRIVRQLSEYWYLEGIVQGMEKHGSPWLYRWIRYFV
ncbi:MAG: glycosyltransferase [Armatimonadetes bacterium]|nr:glycosyltransferase [Armatimonadota bacterium]